LGRNFFKSVETFGTVMDSSVYSISSCLHIQHT
jgi:hypothetical protein